MKVLIMQVYKKFGFRILEQFPMSINKNEVIVDEDIWFAQTKYKKSQVNLAASKWIKHVNKLIQNNNKKQRRKYRAETLEHSRTQSNG